MAKFMRCAAYAVVLTGVAPAGLIHAGPVWDWIWGRPIYYYPPTAGGHAPAAVNTAPAAPVAAAPAGVTAYYPSFAATGGAAYPAVQPAGVLPFSIRQPAVTAYYPGTQPAMGGYPVTQAGAVSPVSPVMPYSPVVPGPAVAAPAPLAVTTYYAPAPISVNSNYPALPALTSAPAAAYAVPAYAAQPVQPVVTGYAPNYRSTWYRVPLTYYRPVTVAQGVPVQPGVPVQTVTAMQPCNTNTWQVQRAPTWTPFWRRWFSPPPPPGGYGTAGSPYTPVVAAPAGVTYPAAAAPLPAATQPVLSAPPTYGAPAYAAPAYAAPAYAAPAYAAPAYAAPANTAPAYAPSTSVPPAAAQPSYGPAGGSPYPDTGAPNYSPSPQFPSGSSTVPADQPPALPSGASPSTTIPNSAGIAPPPAYGARTYNSGNFPNGISPNHASSVYHVKPIPLPDTRDTAPPPSQPAESRRGDQTPIGSGVAPSLLNARDRTAMHAAGHGQSVTPAGWTAPVAPTTVPAAAAKPANRPPLWNDAGWRSASGW